MIQLYEKGNTNYAYNADHTLHPISCELSLGINDVWQLTLVNPIDDNALYIVENAVVSVNTPYGKRQRFIIESVEKSNDNIVATAIPIFLANDVYYLDKRIVNKNGQEALDIMLDGTGYTGHSDIAGLGTVYFQEMNLNAAINGDYENTFLNRWGGECLYVNDDIYINQRIGADNGARAEFGYNLTGITEYVDMSSVVTRIRPKAYNGHLLPDGETVDSPSIEKYLPRKFAPVVIEYSDVRLATDAQGDEEDITVCDTLDELYQVLRTRAAEEYSKNKVDVPSVSYSVSIADLSKTDMYADIADLVTISLGDTVHAKSKRLGIETEPRCINMIWDCITESIVSMDLGDKQSNFFNSASDATHTVNQVVDKNTGSILADQIIGTLNGTKVVFRYQKDIAQKQDVRAIIFEDLDPDSPTYGATCIGSLGIQIANERNPENTDWDWRTFGDGNGFTADEITSGILRAITIDAVNIIGGTISGETFDFDLDNGIIKFGTRDDDGEISDPVLYFDRDQLIIKPLEEITQKVEDIEATKMYRLVIVSDNGSVFKNGSIDTNLRAIVYSWDDDVTDQLDDNQFIWTRVSADEEADQAWNTAHAGGTKTIHVTAEDVYVRATFYCDLIDTTTRMSLL